MVKQIVPDEVFALCENEVQTFKNYTSGYIVDHYPLGVSDLIVRFRGKQTQVIKNMELFDSKFIVSHRCKLLAVMLENAGEKYPGLLDDLDVILPICLSDTTEVPLQEIPCLVFSKTEFSNNILIPSVNNYLGHWEVETVDAWDQPLNQKIDMLCFVGSLTGRLDDLENNIRLQMGAKASEKPDEYYCRLLRPPQMDETLYNEALERCKKLHPNMSPDILINNENKLSLRDQLVYKFQVCIDGHTCAWARLPWQMKANCVPIKIRNRQHAWREWYYPLLDSSKHFLQVDIDEVDMAYDYLVNNTQAQEDINEAGKSFVDKYISVDLSIDVFIQTLLLLNEKQDNTYHVKSEQEAQA